MPPMITGLDFVYLPVSDMERAKRFYREVVGLAAIDAGTGAWQEYDLGGPALALVDAAHYGMPAEPVTTGAVAIATHAFDQDAQRLEAQGRLKQPPCDSPSCHAAFASDPEGNAIVLHQRKAEPDRHQLLDFVQLPVEDMARARKFYEGELGFTPETVSGDSWVEYVLPDGNVVALGDVRGLGLTFKPVVGGGIGLHTPALEAAFARLKALGHATMDQPYESPVCFMGFIRDSEGNSLVLHRHK